MSNRTEQPVVNTNGALGKPIVDVVAVITELEMKLRLVLEREGFERKKTSRL